MKKKADTKKAKWEPISILKKDKELIPEVAPVLELAKDYSVPVGSGHLSKEEINALAKLAQKIGTQILITHPHNLPPALDDERLAYLVSIGCKIEICAGTVFPAGHAKIGQVVQSIKAVGYKNYFISTDAGRPTKPMPAETLSTYLFCLLQKGIPKEHLEFMTKESPAQIFGLPN